MVVVGRSLVVKRRSNTSGALFYQAPTSPPLPTQPAPQDGIPMGKGRVQSLIISLMSLPSHSLMLLGKNQNLKNVTCMVKFKIIKRIIKDGRFDGCILFLLSMVFTQFFLKSSGRSKIAFYMIK